jgi:hypothetical protein
MDQILELQDLMKAVVGLKVVEGLDRYSTDKCKVAY